MAFSIQSAWDRIKTISKPRTAILFIIFILLTWFISVYFPSAGDWHKHYRPAALAMIQGQSPFQDYGFLNAPWVLLPMIPLLLVPESVGRAILAIIALASIAYVSHKLGGKPLTVFFILLSPPVFQLILDGNVDWMMALGFVLPPQIGLFFLVIKPQTGIGVILLWFVQAFRNNGWREVVRVFFPVTIALLLSFLFYGFWPMSYLHAMEWRGNSSIWPMSVPVGLALMATAFRKNRIEYAMAASPCLAPYVLLHTWISPLLAISPLTAETICTVIGMWIWVIIKPPV